MSAVISKTSKADLAEALFASTLQESEQPSPADVRAAVTRLLSRDHGRADCLARVATEAGDHPETYVARMRWALHAVAVAYPDELATAA